MTTVKLSVSELLAANQGLVQLATDYKLSSKLSYRVSRLIKKLESELKTVGEQQKLIVNKHGSLDETNGKINILPESKADYTAEWKEFVETEISVEVDLLTPDMFGDTPVTPAIFVVLDKFMAAE